MLARMIQGMLPALAPTGTSSLSSSSCLLLSSKLLDDDDDDSSFIILPDIVANVPGSFVVVPPGNSVFDDDDERFDLFSISILISMFLSPLLTSGAPSSGEDLGVAEPSERSPSPSEG